MDSNWDDIYEDCFNSDRNLIETITTNSLAVMTTIISGLEEEEVGEGSSRRKSWYSRQTKGHHCEVGNAQLMNDYFIRNPVYSNDDFRRRYRMKHPLFLRLLECIQQHNPYFVQRVNCAKRMGFTAHQKITVALRMLAYGSSADALDENLRMGKSTTLETLREFCSTMVIVYKEQYLRAPTSSDLQRLLQKAERRGFPGMIGSLDCMHWQWRNCPTSWKGVFSGRSRKPNIVLEAVASHDTWIWHAFFCVPGSRNDISTLGCSHMFDRLTQGDVPTVHYTVNGREHHMPYYLVDGIYPNWATFVQSIKNTRTPQEEHYSKTQESYRKDVERAFGILQVRFLIIKQPGRGWNRDDLHNIMMTCIILHNIIVEDERDDYIDDDSEDEETDTNRSRRARAFSYDGPNVDLNPRPGDIDLDQYMMRYDSIRPKPLNRKLQQDLIKHLWTRLGQGT